MLQNSENSIKNGTFLSIQYGLERQGMQKTFLFSILENLRIQLSGEAV